MKKWLQPTKNKIIASVVAVLIIGGGSFGVWSIIRSKFKAPIIVFKENIIFEYGETLEQSTILEKSIDMEKSTFDTITNEIVIDVSTTAEKKKTSVSAKLGKIEKEFEYEYNIKDTNPPKFNEFENISTPYNTEPVYSEIIKATDIIDGDLEVKIEGDIKYDVAGTYELKAIALDKNGNKSEHPFTVTVQEEVIEVTPVEYNNTPSSRNTSNSGGTASSSNGDSSSQASRPNEGSGNSSGGGNISNTGGGSTTPPKPVEPSRPDPIGETPSGMVFYKDYGSTDGCISVSADLAYKNQDIWINTYCDNYGYLFYTPN